MSKLFNSSLGYFDDVVVREERYRLALREMKLKKEIEKLEAVEVKYQKRVQRRNMIVWNSAFGLMAG